MEDRLNTHLAHGRTCTRMAAQWLTLLQFKPNPNAPTFSPSLSLYHDMLNPAAEDEARIMACGKMLALVRVQLLFENKTGRETYARARPIDPYQRHWRTTERGAALAAVSSLLDGALGSFAAAEPNRKS